MTAKKAAKKAPAKKAAKVQPRGGFPETLGECIDLAYKRRAARLALQKEQEEALSRLKQAEEEIKDHIINSFAKSDIEGARGKEATASTSIEVYANVTDWDKFNAWVAKTKSWDMLQRRVNDKAYRARLDSKVKVPGVEKYTEVKLSLTKR